MGGELVAFKLVNFRVLVRTKEGELSENAIKWTRTYTHDNPFGCWADVGWLVLAPDEILVTRGASQRRLQHPDKVRATRILPVAARARAREPGLG
ncbi:MAG: hypothetical protein H0V17_32110 [Deltaproteobacteria bacterium]|nr:hypothetical protein [Deltaproteobacteria bacterium]